MNICLIDNYDSFTFNIEHQLQMLEQNVEVIRNDAASLEELEEKTLMPLLLALDHQIQQMQVLA